MSGHITTNCIKPVENLLETGVIFAVPFGATKGTWIKLIGNSAPLRVIGSLFPGLCFSYSD